MISILTTVTWLLGLLGSAVWIWLTFQLWKHRGDIQPLGDQRAEPPEFGWPSLALIFAGRNEKDSVESATRSMIAQDYPNLTIIAVNDRSTDSTGAILDRLASEEPKLRAIHVASLPAGWLGKNHALQQAANATDARWLLFTDADIHFEPGVLRHAVAFAFGAKRPRGGWSTIPGPIFTRRNASDAWPVNRPVPPMSPTDRSLSRCGMTTLQPAVPARR